MSLQEKPKREVLAKDERSKTDKNRERRLKKIHQRRKRFFEKEKQKKRAERDLKFRERLERKTARENLRNSTNTKVLKTVRKFTFMFLPNPGKKRINFNLYPILIQFKSFFYIQKGKLIINIICILCLYSALGTYYKLSMALFYENLTRNDYLLYISCLRQKVQH